jgi:hypothetical protein
MPLGSDASACTDEFVAAMRDRLDQLSPPAGGNVDLPDVRANLGALGAAVYHVLTGPTRAQTVSAAADDATFWGWVTSLTAEVAALRTWQQGVSAAVAAWAPADAPGQALKAALLALPQPGPAPAAPARLIGRIR